MEERQMLDDAQEIELVFRCCVPARREKHTFGWFRSLPPMGGTMITCRYHGAVTFDKAEYTQMHCQGNGPYELTLRLP